MGAPKCKGSCRLEHAAVMASGRDLYGAGYKRCSVCGVFVKWDGRACPCCRARLSLRARNTRAALRRSAKAARY